MIRALSGAEPVETVVLELKIALRIKFMGIKKYKPTSPGMRFRTGFTFEEITTDEPLKSLVKGMRKGGGRNNYGRITLSHRGGGHKRRLRLIDFRRDNSDVPGKVASVEYDPNRSAHLALINFADGDKRYILQPVGSENGRHRCFRRQS